jgi:hypothetical protein
MNSSESFRSTSSREKNPPAYSQCDFSRLPTLPDAPINAGVYRASRQDIERIYKGLLFNGRLRQATVHDNTGHTSSTITKSVCVWYPITVSRVLGDIASAAICGTRGRPVEEAPRSSNAEKRNAEDAKRIRPARWQAWYRGGAERNPA